MPGGDRTGPAGMGPLTGRRAGFCSGFSTPGSANPAPGYGLGRGRGGMGRGLGRGFGRGMGYAAVNPYVQAAPYSAQDEAKILKDQAASLKNEINAINARINELESSSGNNPNES